MTFWRWQSRPPGDFAADTFSDRGHFEVDRGCGNPPPPPTSVFPGTRHPRPSAQLERRGDAHRDSEKAKDEQQRERAEIDRATAAGAQARLIPQNRSPSISWAAP